MYIEQTDIETKISADMLTRIIGTDQTIITNAVKFATDTLTNKLAGRYDIASELAKTGDSRNGTTVEMALNLAVFRIYERIHDNEVPERVVKLYDDTLTELNNVSVGKSFLASLNPASVNGTTVSRFVWGSATKRDHNPYN